MMIVTTIIPNITSDGICIFSGAVIRKKMNGMRRALTPIVRFTMSMSIVWSLGILFGCLIYLISFI